ncbi:mucin-5AC-like [Sphaerodactylus townsendi]|uniref:Uncharacterized protein n=1 Tax=Sphaerodactylus townsendi TaxID=933632 RepID=A0ACB8G748_9SAUR|nr:mucin-5AC-like [Sphaerodactylus townsendi]
MSSSGVKCATKPCVTSCPDAEVVIFPPPLKLTLPGLILATSPGKTLVETETACLTNGSDGNCAALVTKSSGPRAICGSTPCCISTTPDSQMVIKPPPVCITIPGAVLTSFPNECLIATSQPCIPAGSKPLAITRSTSVTNGSVTSAPLTRSSSVPCGLDSESKCVTQGASSKVVIYPPPIELIIPGPVLEIAAEECTVEVHNPCENLSAITSGEQRETKALTAHANSSTEVCGSMGASPCVSQGPEMKITIQPPPIAVDLPGPILQVFPEECKVETLSPCSPENPALCESSSPALTNGDSSGRTVKRPLPDIRRPPRPWAEMYSRSVTPRSLTTAPPPIPKHRKSFSSASCY